MRTTMATLLKAKCFVRQGHRSEMNVALNYCTTQKIITVKLFLGHSMSKIDNSFGLNMALNRFDKRKKG